MQDCAVSFQNVKEANSNGQLKLSEKCVLVVGAGGIGCELLKNLVLSDFKDITLIDLDTIDVSNLNRQFLFRKEHVGKSKAEVAKSSVLNFNPNVKIRAIHGNITSNEYDVSFFQTFDIVLNALDNRAARNHVNRMCLAAGVPLIESGSSGYLGQVDVILKGVSKCYECQPKPSTKSYPACTIRNTPSEPIHCIVWAKYLFNQLFGEEDADQDVAPDAADPELKGEEDGSSAGVPQRISTRQWAQSMGYAGDALLARLFVDDIHYLLSMTTLWTREDRRAPLPLSTEVIGESEKDNGLSDESGGLRDQRQLPLVGWCRVFRDSVAQLAQIASEKSEPLGWDKDDVASMDFVTSAANIRMTVFHMAMLTRFEIKAMAGQIIPAIATTNAIVAGLIILEALKVLEGKSEDCHDVYLHCQPTSRKKFIVPCTLTPPNPHCHVCAPKPQLHLVCRLDQLTLRTLRDAILIKELGMLAPDVEVEGKAVILISSDEDETEDNLDKTLADFNMGHLSRLRCDDFHQQYTLLLVIVQETGDVSSNQQQTWKLLGDLDEVVASARGDSVAATGANDGAGSKTKNEAVPEPTGEASISECPPNHTATPTGAKRKLLSTDDESSDRGVDLVALKKQRVEDVHTDHVTVLEEDQDDLVMLD